MDYGHEQTDKALKKLERKLAREYEAAKKDIERKLKNHLEQFEKLDKEYASQVDAGTMKDKDYKRWRHSAMIRTQGWEELRDNLASDLSHTNEIAMGLINDHAIDCYALNMNYGTYEIENGLHINTGFSMYDHRTVENLMKEDPKIIPKAGMDIPEDKRWNRQKLTSAITQGVLTGDSIPDIARRLGSVADMNETAAIRNARTYTTAAENKGRTDSYERAQNMGIELEQEWVATLDQRTRSSHRYLDGERVKIGAKFSNGCRYPGDPEGRPEEIYNCRCTLVAALKGYDYHDERFSRLPKDMSYEDWKNAKDHEAHPPKGIVNGKDISGSWVRRPDKFDFEIEDVVNAQGFDGLPRVVSPDEFEKAVESSGIIAVRGYTAPDKETLDAYHEQLVNGKWYIDCSNGGAFHGHGMYTAGNYGTELSEKAKGTAETYSNPILGAGKVETMTFAPDFRVITPDDIFKEKRMMPYEFFSERLKEDGIELSGVEAAMAKMRLGVIDDETMHIWERYSPTELSAANQSMQKYYDKHLEESFKHGEKFQNMDNGVFAALRGYDAVEINVGSDDKYFIVVNRTKVILKEE